MTKRRTATRRGPARRGSTSRTRTRRKGGVLAALRQLWAALFNRSAPASGGGGAAFPGRPPRRRWEDDLDRDEFGRWADRDEFDVEQVPEGSGSGQD